MFKDRKLIVPFFIRFIFILLLQICQVHFGYGYYAILESLLVINDLIDKLPENSKHLRSNLYFVQNILYEI